MRPVTRTTTATVAIGGHKLRHHSIFVLRDEPESALVQVEITENLTSGSIIATKIPFKVSTTFAHGEATPSIRWQPDGETIRVQILRYGEWPGMAGIAGITSMDGPVSVGKSGAMELFFQVAYAASGGSTLVHFFVFTSGQNGE